MNNKSPPKTDNMFRDPAKPITMNEAQIRLECLRLAGKEANCQGQLAMAQVFFDWVMNA